MGTEVNGGLSSRNSPNWNAIQTSLLHVLVAGGWCPPCLFLPQRACARTCVLHAPDGELDGVPDSAWFLTGLLGQPQSFYLQTAASALGADVQPDKLRHEDCIKRQLLLFVLANLTTNLFAL